jgi:hypothetical protein
MALCIITRLSAVMTAGPNGHLCLAFHDPTFHPNLFDV